MCSLYLKEITYKARYAFILQLNLPEQLIQSQKRKPFRPYLGPSSSRSYLLNPKIGRFCKVEILKKPKGTHKKPG